MSVGARRACWLAIAALWVCAPQAYAQLVGHTEQEQAGEVLPAAGAYLSRLGDTWDQTSDFVQGCLPTVTENAGCWTATADTLFLGRHDPRPQEVMYDVALPSRNLNAAEFQLGFQPGVDISLWRRLSLDNSLEIRGFIIDEWGASATTPTTSGDLLEFHAVQPVNTRAGSSVDSKFGSKLYDFEINGHCQLTERWSALAGFRYLELDERITATVVGGRTPFVYNIGTDNRLYGFQLGLQRTMWDQGGPLVIDWGGTAGIYGNRAVNTSYFSTGRVTIPGYAKTSPSAFVGEMGVTGRYRFTERLSARFGYRILWIEQVALASDQIPQTDFILDSSITANREATYQGVFLGLQFVH